MLLINIIQGSSPYQVTNDYFHIPSELIIYNYSTISLLIWQDTASAIHRLGFTQETSKAKWMEDTPPLQIENGKEK
jgi:hypothetical protein